MKKIFLVVLMAVTAITASAQVDKGFRMGARVDLGISNVIGDGDSMAFGYGVGWIAEYNFNPNLYLQSGVNLVDISHKEKGIDGTLHAFYGQIPIHVGYRFGLTDRMNLFIQAGPTLGCGLFGSKIDWGGKNKTDYFDHIDRFDLGVGGRVGVDFGPFNVNLSSNYGVLEAVSGYDYHNFNFNVGFAYMF